jgi:hypothetical protein
VSKKKKRKSTEQKKKKKKKKKKKPNAGSALGLVGGYGSDSDNS